MSRLPDIAALPPTLPVLPRNARHFLMIGQNVAASSTARTSTPLLPPFSVLRMLWISADVGQTETELVFWTAKLTDALSLTQAQYDALPRFLPTLSMGLIPPELETFAEVHASWIPLNIIISETPTRVVHQVDNQLAVAIRHHTRYIIDLPARIGA